jgi:hypothetical protein
MTYRSVCKWSGERACVREGCVRTEVSVSRQRSLMSAPVASTPPNTNTASLLDTTAACVRAEGASSPDCTDQTLLVHAHTHITHTRAVCTRRRHVRAIFEHSAAARCHDDAHRAAEHASHCGSVEQLCAASRRGHARIC